LAVLENFAIKEIRVWGKTEEDIGAFIRDHALSLKVPLRAMARAQDACEADIVITTTPVREPVVRDSHVRPGTHINAIGADAPGKQELDMEILKRARVFVDDRVQAAHGGEINVAVSQGKFKPSQIIGELGEVVCGRVQGRRSDDDVTLFDSTGLAVQDVALSQWLFEKAQTLHKGQVLKLNG